jgi:hypothetical protein
MLKKQVLAWKMYYVIVVLSLCKRNFLNFIDRPAPRMPRPLGRIERSFIQIHNFLTVLQSTGGRQSPRPSGRGASLKNGVQYDLLAHKGLLYSSLTFIRSPIHGKTTQNVSTWLLIEQAKFYWEFSNQINFFLM